VRPILPAGEVLRLRPDRVVSTGAASATATADRLCAAVCFDV